MEQAAAPAREILPIQAMAEPPSVAEADVAS